MNKIVHRLIIKKIYLLTLVSLIFIFFDISLIISWHSSSILLKPEISLYFFKSFSVLE